MMRRDEVLQDIEARLLTMRQRVLRLERILSVILDEHRRHGAVSPEMAKNLLEGMVDGVELPKVPRG